MVSWSPGCYIPSFVEIGLPDPEKNIFEVFLPYMGVISHVASSMSSDFHFLVPESLHTKFGSDRHCSFCENPV